MRIILLYHFSNGSSFCVAFVCKHCRRKNQNRRSKMGLTSRLSYAYDAFSSYRVSFSLILSLTKMYLMTSLTMMVLGPVYLVCALFYSFKFPLVVSVECFQLMEPQNPVVVSVEYFQSEYFPAQKHF